MKWLRTGLILVFVLVLIIGTIPVSAVTQDWASETNGQPTAYAVGDTHVWVGYSAGGASVVAKLDRENGNVDNTFQYDADDGDDAEEIVYDDGDLYIGSDAGLVKFDTQTETIEWRHDPSEDNVLMVTVSDTHVYTRGENTTLADNRVVHKIDKSSGEVVAINASIPADAIEWDPSNDQLVASASTDTVPDILFYDEDLNQIGTAGVEQDAVNGDLEYAGENIMFGAGPLTKINTGTQTIDSNISNSALGLDGIEQGFDAVPETCTLYFATDTDIASVDYDFNVIDNTTVSFSATRTPDMASANATGGANDHLFTGDFTFGENNNFRYSLSNSGDGDCSLGAASPQPTLSGSINDGDANSLENANISAFNATTGDLNGSDLTDSNGDYSISLKNGTYDVTVGKKGYANRTFDITVSGNTVLDATLTAKPPYLSTAQPRNDVVVMNGTNVPINATINDPIGQDIDWEIRWRNRTSASWETIDNGTNASGTLVNATLSQANPGKNNWRVNMTTENGRFKQSPTFQFLTANTLTIYNGSDFSVLDDRTVSLNVTSLDSGYSADNSTDDGTFNMAPWPRESLFVTVSADGFATTTIIISDTVDPQGVVLYPAPGSAVPGGDATYYQEFTLDDRTGDFPASGSWVQLQEKFDGSWNTVASDSFGASNLANVSLQDGTIYRVKVTDTTAGSSAEDLNVRTLGKFTGDESLENTTVELTIYDRAVDGEDDLTESNTTFNFNWSAAGNNLGTADGEIVFDFEMINDNKTAEDFDLVIYERGNESNEIWNNSYGVVESVGHTQPLSANESNNTWVVEWDATINGTAVGGSEIIGVEQQPFDFGGEGIPDWLVAFIFVGLMIGIAALASKGNAGVISMVIAAVGALLWFVDFVPDALGGGVVVLALVAGGIMFIRRNQEVGV